MHCQPPAALPSMAPPAPAPTSGSTSRPPLPASRPPLHGSFGPSPHKPASASCQLPAPPSLPLLRAGLRPSGAGTRSGRAGGAARAAKAGVQGELRWRVRPSGAAGAAGRRTSPIITTAATTEQSSCVCPFQLLRSQRLLICEFNLHEFWLIMSYWPHQVDPWKGLLAGVRFIRTLFLPLLLYPAGFMLNMGIHSWRQEAMEHNSLEDRSALAVSIMEEYHTLANSIGFVLNQEWVAVSPFSCLLPISSWRLSTSYIAL